MRIASFVFAGALLGAAVSSVNAQAVDISQLLGMLGDLGTGPSAGQNGTTPLPDGTPSGGTPSGGGDVGNGGGGDGATADEQLIPQENLRAFRNRRPGLRVTAGIAHYKERTENLGHVGPSQVPMPDVPQQTRVLPVIINDLLGSFFDIINQVVTGMNLLTSFQSGTLGSVPGGGFDINSLLQQLTGQQGTTAKAAVTRESAATDGLTEELPEPDQAVVVPVVPGT
jgi:hypothetical protein